MGGKCITGKEDVDVSFTDHLRNSLVSPGVDNCGTSHKDDLPAGPVDFEQLFAICAIRVSLGRSDETVPCINSNVLLVRGRSG